MATTAGKSALRNGVTLKDEEVQFEINGMKVSSDIETNSYDVPPYHVGTSEPGGPQSEAQAKLDSYSYSGESRKFPKISRPVELIREVYDVVVIGSGYGGGVAASRMARGKQSVCILERGKEKWPGEYPSTLKEAAPEVHVTGDFAPKDLKGKLIEGGDPTGLYHLIFGGGQNAFVANGLGGTSLLNANVFLKADEKTLALPSWPKTLQKPGSLDKYYKRAASVLEPAPYPEDFPPLPKLTLLKKQAEKLGLSNHFYRVPQTTRFVNGPNSTGVEMQASALTGMDSTGVNDGSKSSTLVTYVSDAWNWGAEIFCECEVRYVKKHPTAEGYLVFYAWHGAKRAKFKQNIYHDLMWVHAKKFVFFGAGSLGTTEILLRSKQVGLSMSKSVGTGMSGNGDVLAFGYNTDDDANAMGRAFPSPERPIGPTINGIIDCRDQINALDGFVIEEGAVPEALTGLLQDMLEILPGQIYPKNLGLVESLQHELARQKSRRLGSYTIGGSIERTQVYLIMSHDSNQAVMTLKNDQPILESVGVGRSDQVKRLNSLLAKATNAVGGTYINSPFYAAMGQQEITVHPIGGARISSDGSADSGATSEFGELLTGHGNQIHEGLVVLDGSVVPRALGVNPFATITALAERSVEAVAKKKKDIEIDYNTKNGVLDLFGRPAHLVPQQGNLKKAEAIIRDAQAASKRGIEFTEVMSGSIYLGDDIEDFETAAKNGEAARFFLSVHAWDTDTLVSREDHSAMLTGTFVCGAMPGSPFMVLRGDFQLFNQDWRTPDTTNLTYDFDMVSTHGEKVHFHGYKIVNPSVAFSPLATWTATSTLYVTLTRPNHSPLGKGMLNIKPKDFKSELASFSSTGRNNLSKLMSAGTFLSYFTAHVAIVFLAPFSRLQWPTLKYEGYHQKKTPPTETTPVRASDGVPSTMLMWAPPAQHSRPRKVLFIPGAAVDHQIFALPTIKQNAVEYFHEAGFQVFCVTHRVGKTVIAQTGYTTFDARLDIQAALAKIRSLQQSDEPIYVVAHCAGSLALSMGLLDGTIPATWISGITASNVFMNPLFGKVNMIKARLPLPMTKIYKALLGSWFSCNSSMQDAIVQQLLNQVLRLYPVEAKKELCNSVTCHRSELVFGRLWSHEKLNEATHANLSNFLGGTSMRSLEHLMQMGTKGYVMNNEGDDLTTPRNLAHLKGIPILFFSGTENVVFSPESTDTSYCKLRDAFGDDNYQREEIPGRGHLDCWIGSDADKDVYPIVKAHAEKVILSASR